METAEKRIVAAEHYVKRVVYEARCECGVSDVKESNPPRERLCKCGKWVPYVESSVVAPDPPRIQEMTQLILDDPTETGVEEPTYLIWSNERGAWWGTDSSGYVRNLSLAGRYTRSEAIRICAHCRDGWSNGPTEIPVLAADADECERLDRITATDVDEAVRSVRGSDDVPGFDACFLAERRVRGGALTPDDDTR